MSQPAETVTQHFKVLDSAGDPVLSLVTGSFTFIAFSGTAAIAWSPTITEIDSGTYPGWYAMSYVLPAVTTSFSRVVLSNTSTDYIEWPDIVGEVEASDMDSIRAAVVRPIAITNGNFAPANELTFSYVAGDTRSIIFTVTDSTGTGIDLTAYESLGFGIRSMDGTTISDAIDSGSVTGDANGVVTVVIGAGLNFHAIADGVPSVDMRWDFQATLTSSSKKYTLARGVFKVLRQEYRS